MIDVWDVRSKVLFRMGRTAEAIASGKEALRRSPTSTHLAIDLANALLHRGRARRRASGTPSCAEERPSRATKSWRASRCCAAISRARRRRRGWPSSAGGETNAALYTLARVEQKKGDAAEVLRIADELLARARHAAEVVRCAGCTRCAAMRSRAGATSSRPSARSAQELRSLPRGSRGLSRTDRAARVAGTERTKRRHASASLPRRLRIRSTYEVIAQTLEVLGDREGARYWRAR